MIHLSTDWLALLRGALSILVAAGAPWVAWATDQSTLRGAIVVSVVASIGAGYAWVNTSLSDRLEGVRVRRAARKAAASMPPAPHPRPGTPIGPEEKTPTQRPDGG